MNRVDHQQLFHVALVKVQDIARNGTRNTAAWKDVIDVVENALAEARALDAEANRKWPKAKRV